MTKETQIEESLIGKLTDLKYTYRDDIRDRETLEQNFREKFQALNRVNLTDSEFARLRDEIISPDVFSCSKKLRETNYFQREDGTPLHYTLVNIKDWCKNEFEVINQLRINTENSHHRFDVILLINGLPLVQIELKTLEVSPRRAMQQIVDYKSDPGNGYTNSLLCFMQLFIVSNRANTYYFTNNNSQHFSFNADEQFLPVYQLASEDNRKITHLDDFADKFLGKCTLSQLISRYMVLVASEQKLLVMRPYQIYAVKAIVDCIQQNRGNGYIWHTTGSGKTLTSFKASTLLKDNPDIEKCLFVVDRKDLDRQTREEFNKFQEGCVEENTNTETLVRRMLSEAYADKVIVCTIQKLGIILDESSKRNKQKAEKGVATFKERLAPLQNKRIVFIFDECHRSQFGDNHQAIKDFFPNAQLFGFTGTPIFEDNATYKQVDGTIGSYKTTTDIFQKELHHYTITHAIDDKNVLRFHIDYFKGEKKVETGTECVAVDDPVSSLDDHNIFITADSIFNIIEKHYLKKRIIITTHHIGLYSILFDRLRKGAKSSRYKNLTKPFILTNLNNELELKHHDKDVFLFHLHLMQVLDEATKSKLYVFHFVLLRQLLENISSFLGSGNISHVLSEIEIDDPAGAANRINTMSHQNTYRFQFNEMSPEDVDFFKDVFSELQIEYNFIY